ncbi:MAG: DUF2726 domain-containing protein [Gammaproteobacteria bacterium]
MFDRESLFLMLASKDWDSIVETTYRNAALIGSDPVMAEAVRLFESVFFAETDSLSPSEKKKVYESPNLAIELGRHAFSRKFVERFIDTKLEFLKSTSSQNLLDYALQHQERPLAIAILQEIQSSAPEAIADARRAHVSIRSTPVADGAQRTIRLFRSRQEQRFFEAVRGAFPTYYPYPNVALSCVIDYSAVKDNLGSEERTYFFKAIIDTVVFDSNKSYEPKFFIELDSQYHDTAAAALNDRMKDNIFEAANVKLIRIRAYDERELTVERLKELVIEVMRGL